MTRQTKVCSCNTLKIGKKNNQILSEDFSLNIRKTHNNFKAETLKTGLVIDQDSIVLEILKLRGKQAMQNQTSTYPIQNKRERAYVKIKEVSTIHLFVPSSNKELLV